MVHRDRMCDHLVQERRSRSRRRRGGGGERRGRKRHRHVCVHVCVCTCVALCCTHVTCACVYKCLSLSLCVFVFEPVWRYAAPMSRGNSAPPTHTCVCVFPHMCVCVPTHFHVPISGRYLTYGTLNERSNSQTHTNTRYPATCLAYTLCKSL